MTNKGSIECKPVVNQHRINDFDCGVDAINEWYKTKAFEEYEISKSYHLTMDSSLIGFFAIYGTTLRRSKLSQFHDNYGDYPNEVSVICIGQFALTKAFRESLPPKGTQRIPHEKKYSSQGIFHALKICVAAQQLSGGSGIIVHPINDELIPFYEAFGFEKIRQESKRVIMYMPIGTARAIVSQQEPSR